MYGRNAMSTQMFEMPLLKVRTVLRFERVAWPLVNRLRQAKKEYATTLPLRPPSRVGVG